MKGVEGLSRFLARVSKRKVPANAIHAAFNILRSGGQIMILDLLQHKFDKARELYGDTWLGFAESDLARLSAAARHAVIVKSGNMSLGVNLLAALVKEAAKVLPNYDIEIVEMHHRMKVDAPSGTALMLGEAAAEGRGVKLRDRQVRARDGQTGARADGAIGFASVRGGTVVGDHMVTLAGPYERIELSHRAEDRMIFAKGALAAARWGQGKKPGLYSMSDVLGLSG